MSFDSGKAKEIRAKQIEKQQKNKEKKNNIGSMARQGKEKKHKYIDSSTSPIPINPREKYNNLTNLTTNQKNTLLEIVSINYDRRKIQKYKEYPTLKLLSIGLALISIAAYAYLKKYLYWPHERTVQRWISNEIKDQNDSQFDLANVDKLIENYITENKINDDQHFKVILAVDAFSVKPNLIVEENGIIRGTINDERISIEKVQLFKQCILEFEKFSKERKKTVIRDTFVFLVQPLESKYPCFILHLSASTQGKATNQEIEILIYLIEKLNSFKITVVGLGFDGDTTYSKLVKNWNNIVSKSFHSKVLSPIENDEIKKFSLKIAVDPLHLLKRWRYRLFKGTLMQNFKQDENYVNIQQWKENFDIPSDVLFAVKLFNQKITSILYEMDDRPTLSYFF